jgi:hypothetical protein
VKLSVPSVVQSSRRRKKKSSKKVKMNFLRKRKN